MPYCVTVARQTLTLFVGVRILVGQPNVTASALPVLFFYAGTRIRTQSSPACGARKFLRQKASKLFDRGAKPCSLYRPQGALRRLCPWGNQNVTASALPVLFFYAGTRIRTQSSPACGARKFLRQKALKLFDRGAKPCSLYRPQGALRRLCP